MQISRLIKFSLIDSNGAFIMSLHLLVIIYDRIAANNTEAVHRIPQVLASVVHQHYQGKRMLNRRFKPENERNSRIDHDSN